MASRAIYRDLDGSLIFGTCPSPQCEIVGWVGISGKYQPNVTVGQPPQGVIARLIASPGEYLRDLNIQSTTKN